MAFMCTLDRIRCKTRFVAATVVLHEILVMPKSAPTAGTTVQALPQLTNIYITDDLSTSALEMNSQKGA